MKRWITGCATLLLALASSVSAFAMEVPTDSIVRNLNGVQEYIKIYNVSPAVNAQDLIEEPFEYNGYSYVYTGMVKSENAFNDTRTHTETVTVDTEKKDLDVILAALEPTMEYEDGDYHGTLKLDHTTIKTEPNGYTTRSKDITEVKEIPNLPNNDMSYVPSSTVKDGLTLPLTGVEWKVQSSDIVDDVLMPASYVAVATYSGKAYYNAATGYSSTADYVGEISRSGIETITYTITYTGTPLLPDEPEPEPTQTPQSTPEPEDTPAPRIAEPQAETPDRTVSAESNAPSLWMWFVFGGLALLLIVFAVILVIVLRKHGAHETKYYETEDEDE